MGPPWNGFLPVCPTDARDLGPLEAKLIFSSMSCSLGHSCAVFEGGGLLSFWECYCHKEVPLP